MAVTNAISAIVIVGAMLAAGLTEGYLGRFMGVFAVSLAAVNVFGGFLVTRRMLELFKQHVKIPIPVGQSLFRPLCLRCSLFSLPCASFTLSISCLSLPLLVASILSPCPSCPFP